MTVESLMDADFCGLTICPNKKYYMCLKESKNLNYEKKLLKITINIFNGSLSLKDCFFHVCNQKALEASGEKKKPF